MLKNKIKYVILCTGLGLCFAGCGKTEEEEKGQFAQAILVPEQANYDTILAEQADFLLTSQGTASLEFPKETKLSWDKAGSIVKETLVEQGQEVKAGDVLMTFHIEADEIAMEELALKLQRKREDYIRKKDEKEMQLQEAREETEEITNEHSYRIAVLNVEKQQIAYEQYVYETEKALAELEEQLAEQQEFLEENQLVAPFDGVISSVYYFEEGTPIEVGEELLSMFATDTLVVRAYGSEDELRYNMDVTLEGTGFLGGRTYHGKVVSAPNILPSTVEQGYAVIEIEEDVDVSAFLRGGRPGRFSFSFDLDFNANLQEIHNILLVDKEAVQKEERKNYVYVLEDGVVHKRYVTVGLSSKEAVWILDGLTEGQELILD